MSSPADLSLAKKSDAADYLRTMQGLVTLLHECFKMIPWGWCATSPVACDYVREYHWYVSVNVATFSTCKRMQRGLGGCQGCFRDRRYRLPHIDYHHHHMFLKHSQEQVCHFPLDGKGHESQSPGKKGRPFLTFEPVGQALRLAHYTGNG